MRESSVNGWPGRLIAVEGIDGSGLSTHSALLVEWLRARGYRAVLTKEPTNGPIGLLLRAIMRGDVNVPSEPDLMALLFAADRLYHVYHERLGARRRGLVSLLWDGAIVVSDRYVFSSIAYQGGRSAMPHGASVDVDWVLSVNRYAPLPDIVVYIDVPVEVALKRIAHRQTWFVYESADDLARSKEVFEDVLRKVEERGVEVVRVSAWSESGERDVEDVQAEIRGRIGEVLGE